MASAAFAATVGDWTERARAHVSESRLEDALASLDSALAMDPRDRDARVLRARILSWQGRHDAAERELLALLGERPGDPDAGLALAYLRYYQGDFARAEAGFGRLLAADSANSDAREGLERVLKAKAAPPPRPWRVDAGFEYSAFSRREQPDWNQQSLQVSRLLADGKTTVHGRLEAYRQFEMSDFALEAGVASAFHPRALASLAAGWTLAPDFRPEWRLRADGGFLALPKPSPALAPATWMLLGARYDAFELVNVLGLHPGLRFEWRAPWAMTVRASRVREDGGDPLHGGSVRLDGSLGVTDVGPISGLRFWLGIADAPETVRAATVSTRTLFLGAGGGAGRDWLFTLGYARDDREDSWIRHALSAGVARRF